MPTHTKSVNINTSAGSISSAARSYTGDRDDTLDFTWSGAQTNKQLDISIDISMLKSLFILSTKDCTLKTNSTSSPDATLTLVANVAWEADTDSQDKIDALAADITKFYLTSAETAGTIKIRALVDATP